MLRKPKSCNRVLFDMPDEEEGSEICDSATSSDLQLVTDAPILEVSSRSSFVRAFSIVRH